MSRLSFRSALLRLAFALIIAAGAIMSGERPAFAEQKSFLQLFFGAGRDVGKKKTSAPSSEKKTSKPKRSSRPVQRSTASASPSEPEPSYEKLETARKVLIVGDFLAGGLASGLEESFAKSPGVVVVDKSNGSSGLVRNDFYDWPAELPSLIAEIKPDIVVVQLGSNDSQQMRVDGNREDARSPKWLQEYERRTKELIKAARADGKPLIWVGLPSFNFTSMSADMVAFNGIFKADVESAGGEFVDIWDGFVDENGKFVFTGSDINGQQVRLRGSDGINMTSAGRRKMAFYAEKPIRKLLGSAADEGAVTVGLTDENLPALTFPTSPLQTANPVRTAPISMTDPDLDGGSALLGGNVASVNIAPTPRDNLVRDGIAPEAPSGRIDDFVWPKPKATVR